METIYYPRLLWRLRAVMIDSVVVPVAMIGTLLVGVALGVTDPVLRIALLIGPLFILEPLMVALTGGTIGHHMLRLRVMKQDGSGKLNIFAATLRFLVKLFTGWFAFVFVLTSRRHQGLHDFASRSVVVHKDAMGVPVHEALPEREVEDRVFVYPPAWQRILVILGYVVLSIVLLNILVWPSVSDRCLRYERCSDLERIVVFVLDIAWVVAIALSVVLGWKGKLFGARRRLKA
ncbi:MAG TPA: RDD family protein [Gammaproteobacteria bacterium]|jgi:uncharacterized RDD family membrane protein YckC